MNVFVNILIIIGVIIFCIIATTFLGFVIFAIFNSNMEKYEFQTYSYIASIIILVSLVVYILYQNKVFI